MSIIHNYRGFLLFSFVCLLSVIFQYLFNTLVIHDDLLYNYYVDRISIERISEILSSRKEIGWPSFVIPPIFFFIKFCLIAVCFSILALLLGLKVDFSSFFFSASIAEIALILSSIFRFFWFFFFQSSYTLEDIKYFSPLSIVSLFDAKELDPLLIYPLRLLNGFEVLYWLSLALLLKDTLKKNFLSSLYFVACSYGIGLLVWVVLVTFVRLSLS